ncbi:MAG: hypothetical protein M1828_003382 [Chrysothrix sp. TS-e1954]|nr:MAG: hypothetical protein M1828_003382 [Chrysothrix sp. TS-e1954]
MTDASFDGINENYDVHPPALKRRRIEFVPQSITQPQNASTISEEATTSTSHDLYYAIVNPPKHSSTGVANLRTSESSEGRPIDPTIGSSLDSQLYCKICRLPKADVLETTPHEASFVHQLCMNHSHPPSAIDRRRKGFTYLNAQGWDPDTRTGMGVLGEGRLYPIKSTMKDNKEGVGIEVDHTRHGKDLKGKKTVVQKLDAAAMRKLDAKEKRHSDKLQKLFTGNDEVNKYLGVEY